MSDPPPQKQLNKFGGRRRLLGFAFVAMSGKLLAACAPAGPQMPTAAPAPVPTLATVATSAAPQTAPAVRSAPAAATPSAAPPRKGGTLQVGLGADPAGLDPWHNVSIISVFPVGPVYNGLVRMDSGSGQQVVGDLADSWTVSPDGTTYTFKMREGGIRWHDGAPFSLDDVLYSLERMSAAASGQESTMAGTAQRISKIEMVDSTSFRIVLKQPSGDFIWEMAQDYAKILPKHILVTKPEDLNKAPIGTGPFKFKEFRPGAYVDLVRNPDYAIDPALPYMDGIRYTSIPDRGTRLAAMSTGRVDTLGRSGPEWLNIDEVKQIQAQNPSVQAWELPDLLSVHFMMNSKKPPFNDVRVRKAAFLATDRQLAMQVVGKGVGLLPGFFPKGFGMSQADLAKIPGYRTPKDEDLAEAKKLLADAGFADGLAITVLSRTQSSTLEPAQFIIEQLQKVGFQPTIKPLEDAQFWDAGGRGEHQAMVFTPGTALPIDDFGKVIAAKGRLNFMFLEDDAKANQLWNAQQAESDQAKRSAVLKQIEQYWLTELYGTAPLVWIPSYFASTARVQNFPNTAQSRGGMLFDTTWLSQ